MRRIWFFVLALSLGVNAGLLYVALSRRGAERLPEGRPEGPAGPRVPERVRRQQPPPEDFESVIRNHLERMTQDLNLDRRQRSAIAAVHERLLPLIVAEKRDMEALRGQATNLYGQTAFDTTEFRVLVRRLSLGQTRLDSLVTDAMLGEAAVLTHEQRLRYVRTAPWGHPLSPPGRPSDEQRGERGDGPQAPPPDRRGPEPAGPGDRRSPGGAR